MCLPHPYPWVGLFWILCPEFPCRVSPTTPLCGNCFTQTFFSRRESHDMKPTLSHWTTRCHLVPPQRLAATSSVQFPNTFITPNKTPCPSAIAPHPALPEAPGHHGPSSVPADLPVLVTSHKWSPTTCSFLTGFVHRRPCHLMAACVKTSPLPFRRLIPHRVYGPHCVHPLIGRGPPGRVPRPGHCTWRRREHGWMWTCRRPVFDHFQRLPRSGADGLPTAPRPPSPCVPSSLRTRDFLSNPRLGVCFWKTRHFTEVEICRFL